MEFTRVEATGRLPSRWGRRPSFVRRARVSRRPDRDDGPETRRERALRCRSDEERAQAEQFVRLDDHGVLRTTRNVRSWPAPGRASRDNHPMPRAQPRSGEVERVIKGHGGARRSPVRRSDTRGAREDGQRSPPHLRGARRARRLARRRADLRAHRFRLGRAQEEAPPSARSVPLEQPAALPDPRGT